MSLLNQLFNRGVLGAKCKTCLNLAISRIKLLQNKRDVQLKLMRKEIAQFLLAGQEAIARIRVEHVIREQNIWAAYEILEMFCEFVLARVPILESQRDCPLELREAVASIIFAAPRCSDLPDMLQIRNLFAAKYGKEFISAASELRPDTSVNRTIIEKLSVSTPPAEVKLKVLKDIAQEYNVEWDSSNTEAEFSKKPEDLLDGPKQISVGTALSRSHSRLETPQYSPPNVAPSVTPTTAKQGIQRLASNFSSSHTNKTEQSLTDRDVRTCNGDVENQMRPQSSDVLERARAAIAAAERATAAARAAAALVNVNFSSWKPNEVKS
ncbi:hypothetical protein RJ640_017961 [Escallonia rubra]|uniref:IST1 homolog n=1 Tax=Escallonia rubra TaxID=112253 RepID=A0AA88QN83_9ASTE|nr:hypothetical protein RJ640_017961 [Escallonia rubra]